MKQLTMRQRQVYDFLVDYREKHGFAPTLKEIAEHLQVSGNLGVLRHLAALEKKGYLRRTAGSSRGISLTRDRSRAPTTSLPLVGSVAAGGLSEALEHVEDSLEIDSSLVRGEGAFVLKVRGDSMIEAGILDGDLAVVRPQATADNGEIVVAMLDGEATLKRFYREAGQIRLQPENPAMAPIILSAADGDLRVLGKVTAIVRQIED